jgi:hypothetical protein
MREFVKRSSSEQDIYDAHMAEIQKLKDENTKIHFLYEQAQSQNNKLTDASERLSAIHKVLEKKREKCEKINKGTASELWREGARWNLKLIEELLKQ